VTKILIVEDDASQARLLARAISVRRPEYTVITAPNGEDATRLLSEEEVDLVLTDLQMPGMNGLELLAWLLQNRPNLPVFTMTAYGTAETLAQLGSYGSIECFVKPVDIGRVVEHMSDSLSQSIRGHVQNLSLASFLQLVEMERKTCTLKIEHQGNRGTLYVRKGVLIDARCGDASGEDAAITILTWEGPSIAISGTCLVQHQAIDKPFSFLILEAMRLQDESARTPADTAVAEPESELQAAPASKEATRSQVNGSTPPAPARALLDVPPSALAVAVVDTDTGVVMARGQRGGVPLEELASMAAELLRHELLAVSLLDESERVRELVVASKRCCELIRPLLDVPGVFLFMIFDSAETNLVMARLELERLLSTLSWLSRRPVW